MPASARTEPVWPFKIWISSPALQFHAHRLVVAGAVEDVADDHQRADGAGVALEDLDAIAHNHHSKPQNVCRTPGSTTRTSHGVQGAGQQEDKG